MQTPSSSADVGLKSKTWKGIECRYVLQCFDDSGKGRLYFAGGHLSLDQSKAKDFSRVIIIIITPKVMVGRRGEVMGRGVRGCAELVPSIDGVPVWGVIELERVWTDELATVVHQSTRAPPPDVG